jgi:hypothetical protein
VREMGKGKGGLTVEMMRGGGEGGGGGGGRQPRLGRGGRGWRSSAVHKTGEGRDADQWGWVALCRSAQIKWYLNRFKTV